MSLWISLSQISKIIDPIVTVNTATSQEDMITGLSTDSRSLNPGDAFLALKGEHFDGHNFLEQAISKGAKALILESTSSVEISTQIPQLLVTNTLEAYQKIARWWRLQHSIPVIGVTGSVGKTTTKELIAAVLATQGRVLKTQANYNNEIGVSKTLLEIQSFHDYAVIEMAMRAKGEIALLTQISCPTIGLITNVGTAHIGRLGSKEAIAAAKCELLTHLPTNGTAILNYDNHRLMKMATQLWQGNTVTFGLEGGDICGKILDNQTIRLDDLDLPLPLPGRHNALNYLGAIAVAKVLGIDLTTLQQGLVVDVPSGRAKTHQLNRDIIILDETYNAGLESMLAALELLQQTPGKRHIAILGTMKELGEHAVAFHRQVGEKVKNLGIDYLLLFIDEPATEAIALGATGVTTECFTSQQALQDRLQAIIQPGDRLLFKASRSVGLDKIVKNLINQEFV